MITAIRTASAADIISFYRWSQTSSYVFWDCGVRKAIGGLIEKEDRIWGYLDIRGKIDKSHGIYIVRMMKRVLRAANMAGHDVYIVCESEVYPSAPRLLKACGFVPTTETYNGSEVWKCQA